MKRYKLMGFWDFGIKFSMFEMIKVEYICGVVKELQKLSQHTGLEQ